MGYIIEDVLVRDDPAGNWAPILVDSPHSGRHYPADFHFCGPLSVLRQGEDAYVEELVATAPEHGATLIYALFARSYVDANRAVDDIDPNLIAGQWPEPLRQSDKGRAGMGLIRSVSLPGVPLYDGRLTVEEIADRIDRYYAPYHFQISSTLDALAEQFGAVWHLNCHSMPSSGPSSFLPEGRPGHRGVDFVIGDRHGTTASRDFVEFVTRHLTHRGYTVAHNAPYAGVELIGRYADPRRSRHAIQLEINRSLYMDEETQEKHEGFSALRDDLGRLLADVCAYALAHVPAATPSVAAE